MIAVWTIWLFFILALLFWKLKKIYSFWDGKGVKNVGLFGALKENLEILYKPYPYLLTDCWKKHGRIYGTYQGIHPTLFVCEPELIKDVFVKDFASFSDRYICQRVGHPISDRMVTNLSGENWKNVRSVMTPSFSSGKLKQMATGICDTADFTVNNMLSSAKDKSVLDIKRNFGTFSLDIFAKIAFATELNSCKNPDSELVTTAKRALAGVGALYWIGSIYIPKVFMFTGLTQIPTFVGEYFNKITVQIIEKRKQQKFKKADFLQLLLNAHDEQEKKLGEDKNSGLFRTSTHTLDMEGVTAQSALFFVAAYETTGSTLTYMSHSLAVNPHVQDKLIKEIDDKIKSDEDVNFDTVQNLPYMEATIYETLRMYPVITSHWRKCVKETTLGGVKFTPGMTLTIPTHVIQHDPEFYPEPEMFKPERFLPENKDELVPHTFLAFGEGPRHCMGMRLALTEIKILMTKILRKMRFERCPETVNPIKFKPRNMILTPEKPIRVRVVERNH